MPTARRSVNPYRLGRVRSCSFITMTLCRLESLYQPYYRPLQRTKQAKITAEYCTVCAIVLYPDYRPTPFHCRYYETTNHQTIHYPLRLQIKTLFNKHNIINYLIKRSEYSFKI